MELFLSTSVLVFRKKVFSISSFSGVLRDKKIEPVKLLCNSGFPVWMTDQGRNDSILCAIYHPTALISDICLLTKIIFSWVFSLLNVVAAFSLMIKSNSVWNHNQPFFVSVHVKASPKNTVKQCGFQAPQRTDSKHSCWGQPQSTSIYIIQIGICVHSVLFCFLPAGTVI